jgi:uncharacterized membrane protein YgcG
MGVARWFRHLAAGRWSVGRAFDAGALEAVEQSIAAQERRHDGEICFVVEGGLPASDLWDGVTSKDRALELFGRLRVWDTESNAGVLIYVMLADRHVEIIADRGIHRLVGETAWETICGAMQREFAAGRYRDGALLGVEAISDLLATHFPPGEENPNELSNRPVVL